MPCPKSLFKSGFCLGSLCKLEASLCLPCWESTRSVCGGTELSQQATSPPACAIICCVWLRTAEVLLLAGFSRRDNSVKTLCVCPLWLSKKPNSLCSKALNMSTKYLAVGYNYVFLLFTETSGLNFLQLLTPPRDGGYQRVQLTLWHRFKIRHCSFSRVLLWILTKLEAVYKLSNNGGRGDCMGV